MTHNQKMYSLMAVLIALLAIVIIALTSCRSSRSFKSSLDDSTSVKKSVDDSTRLVKGTVSGKDSLDQVNVKKSTSTSKEENDWWKTTYEYLQNQPKGGDTIINNIITPTRIIYEGGKNKKEETVSTVDSNTLKLVQTFMAAYVDSSLARKERSDSTRVVHERSEGTKKTGGLSLWWILAAIVAMEFIRPLLQSAGKAFMGWLPWKIAIQKK